MTKKVKKAYTSLHAICEMHMTLDRNNEGRAVYISAPGDLNLACISWNFVSLSGYILETAEEFCSWVFEEVLPAIRGAGKLEASLRQELVLKDKEHQEELDRAMRALAIKDKQLAAKDEEIQGQLAAKDEENSLQSKHEETHKQLGTCA